MDMVGHDGALARNIAQATSSKQLPWAHSRKTRLRRMAATGLTTTQVRSLISARPAHSLRKVYQCCVIDAGSASLSLARQS
jgi:hypothetical protein